MSARAWMLKLSISVILSLAITQRFHSQQTSTFHLHKEASTTSGLFQLKTAGPDAASSALQSIDFKNKSAGEYIIKAFDTQAGVPNVSGSIPSGSTVSFTLWMQKTANFGTMYPRVKLNVNSPTGPSICTTTGTSALTTTLVQYSLNCTTSSVVALATADRFYLWTGVNLATTPGNKSVKADLDIEGILNGNYDSRITVPIFVPPPFISSLSPVAGTIGTSVTITGANFGGTQGSSTVTFNGLLATSSGWTNSSILASVPAGASSGLVTLTVNGTASNGQTFSVFVPGSLGGTVSRASDSTPVSGALIEALQSGLVKASNVSGGNGSYALTGLAPGVYDLRVSATGYGTAFRTGIIIANGGTTTSNISLFIAGSISGKVTKTDGTTPIASATLKLYQGSTTVATASTNASGDYVVPALDPGSYTVEATAAGYKPNSQSGVVVSEGMITPLNLSLSPAGPINYIYDELGRLVSVVDSTGDVA